MLLKSSVFFELTDKVTVFCADEQKACQSYQRMESYEILEILELFCGYEFITYLCEVLIKKNRANMPEIFRLFGLKFFFYSREHEPIHVHVKSADGKAKFDILPEGIQLVYNKGMKPKDVKCAEMVLEENKELAISKWNDYFRSSIDGEEDK